MEFLEFQDLLDWWGRLENLDHQVFQEFVVLKEKLEKREVKVRKARKVKQGFLDLQEKEECQD
jgi:hypothetical protein